MGRFRNSILSPSCLLMASGRESSSSRVRGTHVAGGRPLTGESVLQDPDSAETQRKVIVVGQFG
jgi:hypothetical protein